MNFRFCSRHDSDISTLEIEFQSNTAMLKNHCQIGINIILICCDHAAKKSKIIN
jgi:hypothetical protein